ncbi:tetratricopeptide repeat protein [Corallococcus sicarius]|uniref:Protein kinase n=1 Tax=Corallococcus sicarius TaxID=2316726 RepID=A0A3A8NRF4_9BACT|nr:tetratricopeptide repeat protein [Corallococcus sicarius]RKH44751.1 protein kinase [Corallococcus sicarius]
MACPDETTLSDFLEGRLSEEARTRVVAHLEGCADCQWVLAVGNDALPGVAAPEPHPAPLARGATLSRYVVLERLGAGAMGVVYAAYDPELDRQVALKVVRPEGRHVEELQRRLLLEAQALARLSHPHVVTLYDVGTYGDCVFLAMELVDGTTLQGWLQTPRAWADVLRVFQDAGRGLAAAHAAGLVHRDFKPANVLVGKNGGVWVTDFGMARPLNREQGLAARAEPKAATSTLSPLTRTGVLLGTPAYMAPELVKGQRADALSDQFSFCVALYEALFGVRPFAGDTLEEMARAAEEGRVRPPLRDVRVPARVRRTVLRGLRARPEERFASMEALLTALTPPSHREVVWMATAVLAALLVGALVYGLAPRHETRCEQEVAKLAGAWGPARRERIHAAFLATGVPFAAKAWDTLAATLDAHAAQWRTLRTEACLSATLDDMSPAWQTETCLDARLWQFAAVAEVLEKADARTVQNAQQLAASLEGLTGCKDTSALSSRPQPPDALAARVDTARQKLAQAQASLEAGRYPEGLALTTALLGEIEGLGFRPLEAEVLLAHGHLLAQDGKHKEAEDHLYKAVFAAEAGHDDETAARAWGLLVWVMGDLQARAADVERIIQHAQAAVTRLGPERFPAVTMDLHLWLGAALIQQGKLDRAEEELTRGLELARKTYGEDHLRTAHFNHNLGRVYSRQGRSEEALALHRQNLALRERHLGPKHPQLTTTLNSLAGAHMNLGRLDEAIALWRRIIEITDEARLPEHVGIANSLGNLGTALRGKGELDEAWRSLERARDIMERIHGPDHPHVAVILEELALVAHDADRVDEALRLVTEGLERIRRSLGPDTPRAQTLLRSRGRILLKLGRTAEARKDLLASLKLLEKEQGPDSPSAAFVDHYLADVAMTEGNAREALGHCKHALMIDERRSSPQSQMIGADCSCIGEALLALKAPEEAEPLLERARQILQQTNGEPLVAAKTSFLLARALSEKRTNPDPVRAVALAEEARVKLAAMGVKAQKQLAQVLAWQRREARK